MVLDLTMPGMPGEEVLRAIREANPGLPVLLSSGFDETQASHLIESGLTAFLRKPYRTADLLQSLADLLGHRTH